MRKRRIVVTLVLAIGVALVGVLTRKERRVNILLITLDTTRADRLGCYGHSQARTPTIDSIADAGVLFENAYSPSPITLPSHATILSGILPPEHGIRVNGENSLPQSIQTLPEILRDRGYRTGAFVSASVLHHIFGLDKGFDHYDEAFSQQSGDPEESTAERPANLTMDSALSWLKQSASQPFFCWIHLYDPHFPYEPPAEYLTGTPDPYDGEIAFADAQIARAMTWIKAQGTLDNTLIIVTADHGESLGEHDEQTHGFLVYNATQRVPLILSLPKVLPQKQRVASLAGLVDLTPTVLDILNIPAPPTLSGVSLLEKSERTESNLRRQYIECQYGFIQFGWSPLQGLITNQWKYVRAPQPELYDRAKDPAELTNVAPDQADIVAQLELELTALESRMVKHKSSAIELNAQTRSQIESLGYIAGGTISDNNAIQKENQKNPREMMMAFQQYCDARELSAKGETTQAIALLEHVVSATPQSPIIHCELSSAYSQLGQFAKAKDAAEAAIKLAPQSAEGYYARGVAAAGEGRFEESTAMFERAVELRPSFAFALNNLALSLVELGRLSEAIEKFKAALELRPRDASYHFNLGVAFWRNNRLEDAGQAFQQAIALQPRNVNVVFRLAQLRLVQRQYKQAIEQFRYGRSIAPSSTEFSNGLAWILATCPDASLRNGQDALQLATASWEASDKKDANLLDTLAAAYAETNQMDKAVTTAQQAVQLASESNQTKLAAEIEARLLQYQSGHPHREAYP